MSDVDPSADEERDEIPVEATTNPLDDGVEIGPDEFDDGVEFAQDMLGKSSAFTGLIEVPEGMAFVMDAQDRDEPAVHFAHVGALLRSFARDQDMSVTRAASIAIELSDPNDWEKIDDVDNEDESE